jgi:hypothetical protein
MKRRHARRQPNCTWIVGFAVTVGLAHCAAADDLWKHPDPRCAAIDAAVEEDNYSGAQKLLGELRAEAKRTGEAGLLAEVQDRGRENTRLSREFDKIGRHLKTLKKNAWAAKASLAAGKFFTTIFSGTITTCLIRWSIVAR